MDNLVLLCRFHHRLVHEGGFGVQLSTSHEGRTHIRFQRPDGEEVTATPDHPLVTRPALTQWHRRTDIDGRTSMPLHPGGSVDYGWVLVGLRG